MSINEFNGAIEELRELSRQMSKECTRTNYEQVIGQLKALKDQKILKKVYWALCHRAFAVMYPEHISNIVNTDAFFRIYNYCNNRFDLGLSGEGDWFDLNMELKEALNQAIGSEIDSITLNMSLWHLYAHFILEKNDTLVTPDSTGDDEDEQGSEPHDDLQLPKTASCMDLQVQVKPIKPSILPCAPASLRHMPDWTEKKRVNADAS